jgi:hypothetical protein
MSDRLALAHVIEDAGIPRDKAENVATAIARFVEGSAATKADVQASEAAVRTDLQAFRATVASEIARLETRIERLDAKVEQTGQRTFNRLGALVAVVAGLLFAALHAWPPH